MKKLLFIICILFASTAQAQVNVAWDDDANLPTDITEYRLYISTTPGGTGSYIKVTPTTLRTYTIPRSAMPAKTNYVRMTAFDATSTMESGYSNEIVVLKNLASPVNLRKP